MINFSSIIISEKDNVVNLLLHAVHVIYLDIYICVQESCNQRFVTVHARVPIMTNVKIYSTYSPNNEASFGSPNLTSLRASTFFTFEWLGFVLDYYKSPKNCTLL